MCTTTGTFPIDARALTTEKDGIGTFVNQSCDWYYFNAGDDNHFSRRSKSTAEWEAKSTYYKLKRDPTFLKRVVQLRRKTSESSSENRTVFAIVVYRFGTPITTDTPSW